MVLKLIKTAFCGVIAFFVVYTIILYILVGAEIYPRTTSNMILISGTIVTDFNIFIVLISLIYIRNYIVSCIYCTYHRNLT